MLRLLRIVLFITWLAYAIRMLLSVNYSLVAFILMEYIFTYKTILICNILIYTLIFIVTIQNLFFPQ